MEQEQITAFDTLYSTNHIQICKLALVFLPEEQQKFAAVFIKYLEFNYALKLCLETPFLPTNAAEQTTPVLFSDKLEAIMDFFPKILPFCTQKEASFIEKLLSLKNTYDSFEQMKPLMEMMTQMNTEASSSMDMLKGFLSPEQQTIFNQFQEEMK